MKLFGQKNASSSAPKVSLEFAAHLTTPKNSESNVFIFQITPRMQISSSAEAERAFGIFKEFMIESKNLIKEGIEIQATFTLQGQLNDQEVNKEFASLALCMRWLVDNGLYSVEKLKAEQRKALLAPAQALINLGRQLRIVYKSIPPLLESDEELLSKMNCCDLESLEKWAVEQKIILLPTQNSTNTAQASTTTQNDDNDNDVNDKKMTLKR